MTHLSTSSSDPLHPETQPSAAPKAFCLSLLLLALVELTLRWIGPNSLIAYEQGNAARQSIRHHILAGGVADICFVGSSRTNNGIHCPTVEQDGSQFAGREVTVSNYASGGAQVPELVPMIEYMFRHGRPKVLLMGVEPEQLGTRDIVNQRSAEFWTVSNYFDARREFGSQIDKYLPQMVRNSLEQHIWTLRLRGRPGNLLRELVHPDSSQHPLKGNELHPSHTRDAATALSVSPAKEAEVAEHVRTEHLVEGAYPFSPQRIAMLRRLVELCEKQGVSLVFFEQPNAAVFDDCFPRDTRTRFLEEFRAMTNGRDGAKFYSLDDLGLTFENSDFRDPVHLNLGGARRLSEAVSRTCIRPALSSMTNP